MQNCQPRQCSPEIAVTDHLFLRRYTRLQSPDEMQDDRFGEPQRWLMDLIRFTD